MNASGKGGFFSNGNDASSVAVTVGRNLTERVAIELTYGDDRPLTVSNHGGWGRTAMVNARWSAVLSASGRHALTLAAGPMVLAGGFNGTVPLAHTEAAYEYRGAPTSNAGIADSPTEVTSDGLPATSASRH